MAAPLDRNSVWTRVLNDLKPDAARAILAMKLKKAEIQRIHELSAVTKRRALTDLEQAELKVLLDPGHLLTLLHSRARMALKRRSVGSVRRKTA